MKRRVGRVEKRGIDTIELMEAMDELEKSQGIKKDVLMESIEQALVIAYKRNFECSDENIKVVLDKTDGQMHVYQGKEIVSALGDSPVHSS